MKFLTPEGSEKIKNELVELKTTKRQEIAKRLEEAKALGDLAENAEYASAKEADSHLRLLAAAGAVNGVVAENALQSFDEVRAMTWRLLNPV